MHVQGLACVHIFTFLCAACGFIYSRILPAYVCVCVCVLAAGKTCIGSRVVEARATWQHAWLVQLVTPLITYLQALPPRKTIESFTLPRQAVGCGLAAAQKNASLINYLYVGELAGAYGQHTVKALSAGFSCHQRFWNVPICGSFVLVWGLVHGRGSFQSYLHCLLM